MLGENPRRCCGNVGGDLLAGMGFGALYFWWAISGALPFVLVAGMMPSHLVIANTTMALAIFYFPAARTHTLPPVEQFRHCALPLCQVAHDHARVRP